MSLAYHFVGGGGSAPAVILSAGLGGAARFWQPQFDDLARDRRVLAYDHRGTGDNRQPLPAAYTIAAMADDVIALADAAGLATFHFVGHALGGLVGLAIALRAPERLQKLVLVNAWARTDPHTRRCFDARLAVLAHGGPAAYVKAQAIFLYPAWWIAAQGARVAAEDEHGVAHFQGEDTLMKRIEALLAFDVSERLDTIVTPTLVMAARDDILVPWTCSAQLADGLPQGRLWLTETGGHACSVTDPAPFNAALTRFLLDAP